MLLQKLCAREMDNVTSYFEFLTHNWKKIVLKSNNANLTEPEAQELIWKEFNIKQTKVKEVPSFELRNPILDRMKKLKLNISNNNQDSALTSVPVLKSVQVSKSGESSENVQPHGRRELSPACRKSFKPKFFPPEPTTSKKIKPKFKTPNLNKDIVSKQYPLCSNLMKESYTHDAPPACSVGADVPRASSLWQYVSPEPGSAMSMTRSPPDSTRSLPGSTRSPPDRTMSPPGDTISLRGGTISPPGGTMSPPGGAMSPPGGTMSPPGGTMSPPRDTSTSSHPGGVVSPPKDLPREDSLSSQDKYEAFKCKKCKKQYKQIKSFQVHKCLNKELVKVPCPSCSKLISKTNMSHHLKLHSVIKYKCTKCKKEFRAKEKLKKHINSHGFVRETICEICGKRFSRPNHLKAHVKLHIDGEVAPNNASEGDAPRKLFTCKLCDQKYESGSGLKLHQKKNHPDASTKCDYCSKTFFSTRGMRDHVKIHQQMLSLEAETESEELQTIEIINDSEDTVVVDGLIHMEDININGLVFNLHDEEFNRVIEQYEYIQ